MSWLSSGDWNSVHHWPGMSKPSTKCWASPPGMGAEAVCSEADRRATKPGPSGAGGGLKSGPTAHPASAQRTARETALGSIDHELPATIGLGVGAGSAPLRRISTT